MALPKISCKLWIFLIYIYIHCHNDFALHKAGDKEFGVPEVCIWMYMCVFMCMYARLSCGIYIYIYIYIYTYIHTHRHTDTPTDTPTPTHSHTHTQVHWCTTCYQKHARTHTDKTRMSSWGKELCMYVCMYVCVCMRVYLWAHRRDTHAPLTQGIVCNWSQKYTMHISNTRMQTHTYTHTYTHT